MTGNLGRNQVQALQPILRGETTTTTKKIIASDVGLERLPTCNYKLKYSHVITHDVTTLKDPGPRPAAPVPQKIFNFRLIRGDSIARNFISHKLDANNISATYVRHIKR